MGAWAKRTFDLALAGAGLVVTGPLILPLALAVRLTSRGPAFFVQTRVGRGKRPIRVVKLRTMSAGADRGAQVTASADPRVTPLGKLLRATKLDELPQLWNVVRGDMSIVGPRPETPKYVALYRPEWDVLFTVRPGITDLASLVFRHEEELLGPAVDRERAYVKAVMPAKLGLAVQGVEAGSVVQDVVIILRTLASVLGLAAGQAVLAEVRAAIRALNEGARSHEGAS